MSRHRRLKVLVIDDERVIADTVRLILSQSGFEVAVAYTADHAVRLAAAWTPDILLCDVLLEETNGFDVAIEICETHTNCKVLMFSGQTQTVELLAAYEDKGYTFEVLAKPVPPEELLERLRSLGVCRTQNTPAPS